jgi:SAM-dependent methyltransferase
VLDCGVGLGVGAAVLGAIRFQESTSSGGLTSFASKVLNYTGIDLIELDKTKPFLTRHCPKWNLSLQCLDMNAASLLPEEFDLVFALGTLHHTDNVGLALESTWKAVKPGGTYIAWIINELKPLRAATDEFFRAKLNEDGDLSLNDDELSALAHFFYQLGNKLGDITFDINYSIRTLDLQAGTYKLQTLFYDYFLKCYFNPARSMAQTKLQLFDWFAPRNYHQTSRRQLLAHIEALGDVLEHEVVTKLDGHFFALKRAG